MADVQIGLTSRESAPFGYEVPNTQEIIPKVVSAILDGSAATSAFIPVVEIISDGGVVVAECRGETIAAAGSARVTWFPGADLDEEVVTEPVGVTTEIVYYDTPNAGTPLTMSTTLVSGASYVLIAEGTYSLWNSALGTGTPEANAQFPGSVAGRVSTQVGLDADTCFAKKTGSTRPIGHAEILQLSLDAGATYNHVEPTNGPFTVPQTGHLYRYELTGQGNPLRIKVVDINSPDNYGKLRFTLQIPNGTGTGSGAGSLVPAADTTNNGNVLTVTAGVPVWGNVDGGSA